MRLNSSIKCESSNFCRVCFFLVWHPDCSGWNTAADSVTKMMKFLSHFKLLSQLFSRATAPFIISALPASSCLTPMLKWNIAVVKVDNIADGNRWTLIELIERVKCTNKNCYQHLIVHQLPCCTVQLVSHHIGYRLDGSFWMNVLMALPAGSVR